MVSYFQSPNWPEASKDRIVCTLTLDLQPDVLQVLVEFLTFEVSISHQKILRNSENSFEMPLFQLKAPTDGSCDDDQFVITGQNQNSPVPTMCGINNGQHGEISSILFLFCLRYLYSYKFLISKTIHSLYRRR